LGLPDLRLRRCRVHFRWRSTRSELPAMMTSDWYVHDHGYRYNRPPETSLTSQRGPFGRHSRRNADPVHSPNWDWTRNASSDWCPL
jgi:hypothetical protein